MDNKRGNAKIAVIVVVAIAVVAAGVFAYLKMAPPAEPVQAPAETKAVKT